MSDVIWTKQTLLNLNWDDRKATLLQSFGHLFEESYGFQRTYVMLSVSNTKYRFALGKTNWSFFLPNDRKVSLSMILEDPEVPDQVKENFLFHLDLFT